MMIRILLVDDQKSILEYLKALLKPKRDLKIVGTANNGYTAIEQVAQLQPDVVIMDIGMPGLDGISATKIICQKFKDTKVIVLSGYDNDDYVHQCLSAGSMGYLLKDVVTPEEIIETIRFVHKGYAHYARIEPELIKKIISQVAVTNSVTSSSIPNQTNNDNQQYPKLEMANNSLNGFHAENVGEIVQQKPEQQAISNIVSPETTHKIGWRQLLFLLIFAVSVTFGIYFVRQKIREPLLSLSKLQQKATLGDTEFTGKISPVKSFKIAATTPSVVEEIYVQIGDLVQVGQPLLILKNLEAEKLKEQILAQRQTAMEQQQLVLQQQQIAEKQILELEQKIAYYQKNLVPLQAQIAEADLRVSLVKTRTEQLPLRQRQDSIERTKAIYQRSLNRYKRFEQLYENGAISQDELEQLESDLSVAKTDFEMAQKAAATTKELEQVQEAQLQLKRQLSIQDQQQQIRQLEDQLRATRLQARQAQERIELLRQQSAELLKQKTPEVKIPVKATIPGVVVELPVTIGEQIFLGNILVNMAQMKKLKVEIPIKASLINAVLPGQQGMVKVGVGSESQEFPATITTINPLPNEQLNHIVEVQFENTDNLLLVGQLAAVHFLPN